MKYSTLSFGLMSFVITTVLFLVTVSVSFAQTDVLPKPATIDVNNIQSEPAIEPIRVMPEPFEKPKRTLDINAEKMTPIPTLYGNTEEVRSDDFIEGPRSFLEKARSTLQIKLRETTELRESRLQTDDRVEDGRLRTEERGADDRMQAEERNVARAREERTEKQIVQKKERVNKYLNNINRKMDAAIDRLDTLIERIKSRIVKFEERGVDMSESKRLLEIANSDVRNAVESISTAETNAREALAGDPSRDTFGNVVSELTKTKESLRSAHTSLVQAIKAMKASFSGEKQERVEKEETSSTDENNTEVGETN
jgi:hypothetical protein